MNEFMSGEDLQMVMVALGKIEEITQKMTKEEKRIFIKELRGRLVEEIKELDDLIKAN